MKREEIVQAERELDAVLELIQESEGISGRDDIKEERMKERNRIQEAEAEESLTRINMEDTADMLQYEACRELKRCRDVHILRPGDSLLAAFFVPVLSAPPRRWGRSGTGQPPDNRYRSFLFLPLNPI